MNLENFNIYVVEGPTQIGLLKERLVTAQKRHDAKHDWCKSQGGIGSVDQGEYMIGLLVEPDAKVAGGWQRSKKSDTQFAPNITYVPNRRKKIGKELSRHMGGFVRLSAANFASVVTKEKCIIRFADGACRMMSSQCYQEGDLWLFVDPKDEKDDKPRDIDGCRLIPMSEYWSIKERNKKAA